MSSANAEVNPGVDGSSKVDPLEAGRECLEAALRDQREQGWSVLSCCAPDHGEMPDWHRDCDSPGKRPHHGWTEYQEKVADEATVRGWWWRVPTANVGIALGGPASGLIGIDVDGPDGEAELERLSEGDLPATLEFTS